MCNYLKALHYSLQQEREHRGRERWRKGWMDGGIEGGIRRLLRDSKAFQVGPKQKRGGV